MIKLIALVICFSQMLQSLSIYCYSRPLYRLLRLDSWMDLRSPLCLLTAHLDVAHLFQKQAWIVAIVDLSVPIRLSINFTCGKDQMPCIIAPVCAHCPSFLGSNCLLVRPITWPGFLFSPPRSSFTTTHSFLSVPIMLKPLTTATIAATVATTI